MDNIKKATALIKNNQHQEARLLLLETLRVDRDQVQAWLLLCFMRHIR